MKEGGNRQTNIGQALLRLHDGWRCQVSAHPLRTGLRLPEVERPLGSARTGIGQSWLTGLALQALDLRAAQTARFVKGAAGTAQSIGLYET